ncbi:MAG: PH domain-containing protein [Oligoflexia bacterium]|nr:PH domain-containing protein [Oligoflexia bacterium]
MSERLPLRKTIPLRRRKILKGSLWNALLVLFFGGIVTLIGKLILDTMAPRIPDRLIHPINVTVALWFVFLLVLMFWRMVYQYIYFMSYYYDADEENLTVRKGIITKREIIIPFKRITDVYIDQDLWDVTLGIYDVHISTPTQESGLFAHIDGVDREGALKLRKMILEKISKDH